MLLFCLQFSVTLHVAISLYLYTHLLVYLILFYLPFLSTYFMLFYLFFLFPPYIQMFNHHTSSSVHNGNYWFLINHSPQPPPSVYVTWLYHFTLE